ncbi:MAG: SDR family oxidoreductase [Pseudomonadota bacterium]
MDLELAGKNVFVAAASKGIGRAVAIAFGQEGANVHICGRDASALEDVVHACFAVGAAGASSTLCDLTTSLGAETFVRDGIETWGGIDVLVTNCGGPPSGTFDSVAEQTFGVGINTTLRSVERLCRSALPYLRSSRGSLVHLTSLTVKQPEPNLMLSNALRLAVVGLSKSIADIEGARGVRSNCILTGRTDTERLRTLARESGGNIEGTYARWAEEIPLHRIGSPDDVAGAVLFLSSARARYITGTCLAVDGGLIRSPL